MAVSEYRIQDDQHGVIGPIRLDTVLELWVTGAIGDDTELSKDGDAFLPVNMFPEIHGVQTPRRNFDRSRPNYAGSLGRHSFFRVFYRFHLAGLTGILEVQHGPKHKEIFLESGQPVFFTSNLPSELFGQYLLRKGLLTELQLEQALSVLSNYGGKLIEVLIHTGLMDEEQIGTALRDQQFLRLVDLCGWEEGNYCFYEGASHGGQRFSLDFRVPELVHRAANTLDKTVLNRKLEPFYQCRVARLANALIDREEIPLSNDEREVLGLIDGSRTPHDMLNAPPGGGDPTNILAMLYLLREIDAVEFVER